MVDNESLIIQQHKTGKILDKAKDIPKMLIGFSMVLYLFGFLSLSSFWAQFGIISFDIVNARFIIAGLFSFFSMSTVLLFVWLLNRRLSLKTLFHSEKWGDRFLIYIELITTTLLVSQVFYGVFSLGKCSALDQSTFYKFKPFFGKYDAIGKFVINAKAVTEVTPYIQITVYLLLYVLIFLFLCHLVAALKRIFFPKKQSAANVPAESVKPAESKQKPKELQKNKHGYWSFSVINLLSELLKFIRNGLEAFMIAILGLIFFCSVHNLVISKFGFNSFNQPFELNSNLVFSWFYATILGTFVFMKISNKTITWSAVKFDDFDLIHRIKDAFQFALIPIISGLLVFGNTIFPRIPFTIGGGEPREIELRLKYGVLSSPKHKLFLLGESGQFIFVVDSSEVDAKAFQINKSEIEYIQTKKLSRKSSK